MGMSKIKIPFSVAPKGFSLSPILRKDHRLQIFERRVVTRISGHKKRKEQKGRENVVHATSRNVTGTGVC